jgi:hypothetical protein
MDFKKWWPGPEWIDACGISHFMRLSALRASVELPACGLSET